MILAQASLVGEHYAGFCHVAASGYTHARCVTVDLVHIQVDMGEWKLQRTLQVPLMSLHVPQARSGRV